MVAESAKDVIQAVRELTKANGKPALIAIDTLHRNFGGGDENSAADFGQFLNHIDVMRHELGAAVVIVHHSGHSKADRSRGSSSIKAAMDHEFCVTVEADKTRLLSCTKMKDAASPEPQRFALRGVELDLLDAKAGRILRPCWSGLTTKAVARMHPAPSAEARRLITYARRWKCVEAIRRKLFAHPFMHCTQAPTQRPNERLSIGAGISIRW